MSGLWLHASGVLSRDPEQRASAKAPFAVATLRAGLGDDAVWISVLAFGDAADRLLQLRRGDSASVAGRCKLRHWTANDGTPKTGLSVVAAEIVGGRPRAAQGATPSPRRRPYPRPRPAVGAGGPAPDDRVDDLWPENRP